MLKFPRKKRRGFSLVEVTMVILILIPVLNSGLRLLRDYTIRQSGIEESRQLTDIMNAASTLALQDLNDRITNIVGVGDFQTLSMANLASSGVYSNTAPDVTALRRNIQVIYYAPSSDKLIVLAHAFTPAGETTPRYIPRGGDNIRAIGSIRPTSPTKLRGPGVDYDLAALQTLMLANVPAVGDVIAIDVLSIDADVLPYLHRIAVPGLPDLNKMETDLDLGGYSLVNVGSVGAQTVNVSGTLTASDITGTLNVTGAANMSGIVNVTGDLSATNVTVNGTMSAVDMVVSNSAVVDTLSAQTSSVSQNLSVDGVMSAGTSITTPLLSGSTVEFTTLNADTLNAQSVGTDSLASNGAVNTGIATINNLTVGSCTGC